MEYATDQRRVRPGILLLGAVLLSAGWLAHSLRRSDEPALFTVSAPVEAGLMCPWREPEGDIRRYYPGALGYRTEPRILSAERVELARRLGRFPSAAEHAVYLHRVRKNGSAAGTVLVRRVKGPYGAIEVIAALDNRGRVLGVRLQRHREPASIAGVVTSPEWLGAFKGRTAGDSMDQDAWIPGRGLPAVPQEAQATASSAAEAVRSMLVLYDLAEARGLPLEPAPAHH